jgi:hypothetical protein
MASLGTILSDIGKGLAKFIGVAEKVAVIAEPFVDVAFPGIAPLYNLTVSSVGTAETSAIAAGAQSGTGPQKLALVVADIEASFNQYWTALGYTTPAPVATIENYVNAVVATLNAIPTPPTPA